MQENNEKPIIKYYRVEKTDNYTAQLVSIEIQGRRVGKKTVLFESTPSVIYARWAQLLKVGM